MITLPKSEYEKILAHAQKNLPEEACGLIAGRIEGSDKHIEKVYLLTNIDHSNEHFSLDPKEQLAAIKDMRANGLSPLGNWHAYDSRASYLILSLQDREHPVLNSFHIEGDIATNEGLVIG